MKFFVYGAKDDLSSENLYINISKLHGIPVTNERIFRIHFKQNSHKMIAEVGKPIEGKFNAGREPVWTILNNGTMYFICTADRGVFNKNPILVGINEPYLYVEYFD